MASEVGRERIAKIMGDIPDYHATPVVAAEAANEAGAKLLVLTHLVPPPPNAIAADIFMRGVNEVRPDGWIIGEDGMLITLPKDSDAVTVDSL